MTHISPPQAFEQGITLEAYVETMNTLKRHMREQYEATHLPDATIAEFVARLNAKNINRILVLTEDFCPDSVTNLPIAQRLAEAIPALTLRIVRRSKYWDLANRYPAADGHSHIPTIIFLTADDAIAGVWHERPQAAHQFLAQFIAENPTPPRETGDGEINLAFKKWAKKRLEALKQVYRDELWRESVTEWMAAMNDQ